MFFVLFCFFVLFKSEFYRQVYWHSIDNIIYLIFSTSFFAAKCAVKLVFFFSCFSRNGVMIKTALQNIYCPPNTLARCSVLFAFSYFETYQMITFPSSCKFPDVSKLESAAVRKEIIAIVPDMQLQLSSQKIKSRKFYLNAVYFYGEIFNFCITCVYKLSIIEYSKR